MKKLFTLIALAMSFMGGYAQGTYAVSRDETFAVGQVVTSVPNLTITFSDSDTNFNNGKKSGNFADSDFTCYTSGNVAGGFTEGNEPTGCFYKFVAQYSGILTVGIVLDKNKSLLVVGPDLKQMSDFKYNLPSASKGESQILDENNKLTAKSYGTVTINVKAGETYYVLGKGTKMGFYGVKFSLSLTTAASGFSTLAMPFAVDYKSLGLTAYAIGLDETAKKVTYTEIDGIVPANIPVLVKGEASKTYTLTKAEGDAAEVKTSLLVSDGKVVTEGDLYYAFSTVDGKSGFKRIANGITIPAKKGYLKLASASAKSFFSFDDETTGIKGIENSTVAEEDAPLYNLAGQRVSKDYKGVVVKNGKKFFNK